MKTTLDGLKTNNKNLIISYWTVDRRISRKNIMYNLRCITNSYRNSSENNISAFIKNAKPRVKRDTTKKILYYTFISNMIFFFLREIKVLYICLTLSLILKINIRII